VTRERKDLLYTLSPLAYIHSLGFNPFDWQSEIISSTHKRKVCDGARQSGKSTITSGKPCHVARFYPGSLSVILAATEKQAVEDMEKIKDFMSRDVEYPEIVRDSDSLIELKNKSRILVVPATEKAARGFSSPHIIIMDESSRIEDGVYKSGVIPMLTDNEKCEVILISSPNGRTGFFFKAFQSERWERYEVRSPWDVDDLEMLLIPGADEAAYRKAKAKQGIKAYYSPRHHNQDEQQMNLEEMGPLMYRQEYCCEFVEPDEQVFGYDEVSNVFRSEEVDRLDFGIIDPSPIAPLYEVAR
jgi:hypothetical protein